jgi:hypothetical protein
MAQLNSGPIPGENYTSDTKNYPWRQPPEFTDIDDCLDWLTKKITKMQAANGILNMAELGLPLYKIADMLLTQGVGAGKWTVDFTLLLGGPLTRMIELICIGFGVDYVLGIDDDEEIQTATLLKGEQALRTPKGKFKLLDEEMPEIKSAAEQESEKSAEPAKPLQTEGFMAAGGVGGGMTEGAAPSGEQEQK